MSPKNFKFPKKPLELLSVQEMDELSAVDNDDPRQEVEADDILPILDVSSSLPNRAKRITAGQLVTKMASGEFADTKLSNLSDREAAINNLQALDRNKNLSDLANSTTALTNIGGLAITNNLSDVEDAAQAVANIGALSRTSNLSDLANKATARANLGPYDDVMVTRTGESTAYTLADQLARNVSVEYEINLVEAGADNTGSSNVTPILQQAFDDATASGKTIKIPAGTYRLNSMVEAKPGVSVVCDEGVVIDATNITGGSAVIRFQGSIGTEIPIAAAVQRRDRTITTTSAHGLSAGDWILLKSQRSCLHADAGDWRLGEPTAGDWPVYFAEPLQVEVVNSSTSFDVKIPVIFPDYFPNDNNETLPNARPSATIAKIDFFTGANWRGGTIRGGGSAVFRTNWCFNPRIKGVKYDMRDNAGSSVYSQNTMFGDFEGYTFRDPDGADSLSHNSYRDVGCWWNKWDVVDINGWQGLDVSFSNAGHPSFWPDIKAKSYGNIDGVTFHPGCFGGTVEVISQGGRSRGISQRSRFVQIVNPLIVGPVGNVLAGIEFGPWALDSTVLGGHVEGYQAGIRFDSGYLVYQNPALRNQRVFGTSLKNNVRGIDVRTHGESVNDFSGITIVNCNIEDSSEFHIFSNSYNNGVRIEGNRFGRLLGSSEVAIQFGVNSWGNVVANNVAENLGSGKKFIDKDIPSNRTAFPQATFPDSGSVILRNNTVIGESHSQPYSIPDTVAANTFEGIRGPVFYNDGSTGADLVLASNFPSPAMGVVGPANAGSEIFLGDVTVPKRAGFYLAGSGTSMNVRINGSPQWRFDGASTPVFRPSTDGQGTLGLSSFQIQDIYLVNAPTVSSDEQFKQDFRDYTDEEIRAFRNIITKIYRLKASVNKKGDNARLHSGVIAQQVVQALENEGLDPWIYSFLCKSEDDGRLAIRYEELLVALISAERQRIDDIEDRLKALEKDN